MRDAEREMSPGASLPNTLLYKELVQTWKVKMIK